MPIDEILTLDTPRDTQLQISRYLQAKRKERRLSRRELAIKSGVPAPTIRRFDETGEISLRQCLMLFDAVDTLDGLMALTKPQARRPRTIDEVGRV